MYSTKSFCNIVAFASQEPGVVSPIGELTTYAKTFTKELGFYRHSTLERYELLNFISKKDNVAIQVPQSNVDQAVSLVDYVTKLTLSTSGELYYDEVLTQLIALGGTVNATNVSIGAMVNSGRWWVPQWISWTDVGNSVTNTHKVWISLPAFVSQYTDYEIVVVPPIDNLDQFFSPGNIVERIIKSITTSQMIERAELAKGGFPETKIRSDPYEYNDPMDETRRLDVEWGVLIYGAAGNDPDIIRDALVDYILKHSTHARDEWAVIFPDIFKRTEFVFAPFWDNIAIAGRVFAKGIYSPIIDNKQTADWLIEHVPDYAPEHILAVSQVFSYPYRSTQIASVGHIENKNGKVRISDLYPDYINVDPTSTDFSRMAADTQNWSIAMMRLITIAESITPSTDLPVGVYRVSRGIKQYVAQSINRVLMLVLTASSTVQEIS